MNEQQHNKLIETVKILVYFGLWYALNALYNVYNKKVLRIVDIPWTLATGQLMIGCVWFLPLWITGLRVAPKFATQDLKWLLPLGFYHGMIHLSSVIAMGAGGVSFFQIIKAAEPLFTCAASAIFFREFFHPLVYVSIIPVIFGVSYASLSTLDFSWLAFMGAMLSNIGSVLRAVFSKPRLKNPPETCENLTPGNLFSLVTVLSIFISAPFAIFMEVGEIFNVWEEAINNPPAEHEDITQSTLLTQAALSGMFFYTYNEVAYYALNAVHPVTHAVGNALKRVVVITAAVIFLGETMSLETVIGTVIAIGGVLTYSLTKQHYAAKAAAQSYERINGDEK